MKALQNISTNTLWPQVVLLPLLLGLFHANAVFASGLKEGLVAYYHLDGDAVDVTENHHGRVINAIPCIDRLGKEKGAMSFNGVDAMINCGRVMNNFSAFTISAWINIRRRGNTDYAGFMSQGEGKDAGTWQFFVGSRSFSFGTSAYWSRWGTSLYVDARQEYPLPTDQWHHIVQTYDGMQICHFHNGQLVTKPYYQGRGRYRGLRIGNDAPMVLGRVWYYAPGTVLARVHFDGALDEVRVYNRALSPREVQQLYQMNASQ